MFFKELLSIGVRGLKGQPGDLTSWLLLRNEGEERKTESTVGFVFL